MTMLISVTNVCFVEAQSLVRSWKYVLDEQGHTCLLNSGNHFGFQRMDGHRQD